MCACSASPCHIMPCDAVITRRSHGSTHNFTAHSACDAGGASAALQPHTYIRAHTHPYCQSRLGQYVHALVPHTSHVHVQIASSVPAHRSPPRLSLYPHIPSSAQPHTHTHLALHPRSQHGSAHHHPRTHHAHTDIRCSTGCCHGGACAHPASASVQQRWDEHAAAEHGQAHGSI